MLSLLLDVASPLAIIFGAYTELFVFFVIAFVSIVFLVAMIIIVKTTRKKVDNELKNKDNDHNKE